MGAVPYDGGVSFRVWAPNARNVAVVGDFCGWRMPKKTPMVRDSARSGTWSAFVPGVEPGSEYRFLVRRGGPYLWRIDPFARKVTDSVGNGVVFDPKSIDWSGDDFEMPGWDDLVVYEIHIATFAADENGPGTFDKAIARLDHLACLGVTAVELMPPFEFAGTVSWGYNPSHLFAIESSYGGPEAFVRFVREAHARGIAVILDIVHNHLGPTDLDLWRFDGWRKGRWGGIYFYNDRRAETPWGPTRPNCDRKDVRGFLRDSAETESLRDLVSSIFETNLSLNDMRLNVVMKKLSGWAAIIAVPTLITGWFGMNVPYPGYGAGWGFWLALGVSVISAVVLYITFRRHDWL